MMTMASRVCFCVNNNNNNIYGFATNTKQTKTKQQTNLAVITKLPVGRAALRHHAERKQRGEKVERHDEQDGQEERAREGAARVAHLARKGGDVVPVV